MDKTKSFGKQDELTLQLVGQERIEGHRRFAENILAVLGVKSKEAIWRAVSLMSDNSVFFGVGDDLLDEQPLDPALSRKVMGAWIDIISNPQGEISNKLRRGEDISTALPVIGENERQKKYVLIGQMVYRIRAQFDELFQALPETDRPSAERYMVGLYTQLINGEQATFELVEKLKKGQTIKDYLGDVCVNGNTPAFLLIHFISRLVKKVLDLPTAQDVEQLDQMSVYWQTTDDLLDTESDTFNSQPKAAFFALREMAEIAQQRIKRPGKVIDFNRNPWYHYLYGGLNEQPSDEDLFCFASEDTTEIMKKRIKQWKKIQNILHLSKTPTLTREQCREIYSIISSINFLPIAKKTAYGFQQTHNFPENDLGKISQILYTNKINKLFR